MIIKKVIIDGKELHVQVTKEEAIKALKNEENLIFTSEEEKQALYESLNDQSEESTKTTHPNYRKIIHMLPFLDSEALHDLYQKIIDNDEQVKGISVHALLPFLEDEDVDQLFLKAAKDKSLGIDPVSVAPFVSDKALSDVVEAYVNGEATLVDVDRLYPFLDKEDFKKLFDFYLKQSK